MTIGLNIKRLRRLAKLTQNQLAEAIGVRQSSISRWESEVDHPSTNNLSDLINVLNCTYNDLLGEGPAQKPDELKLIAKYRSLNDADKQKLMLIIDALTTKND